MRIALTGASGFVGRALLDALADDDVVATTRQEPPAVDGVSWIRGDLREHEVAQRLVADCDVVIHAAGRVRSDDVDALTRDNVEATQVLVAATGEDRRFVHLSTAGVHGRPGGRVTESTPLAPPDAYETTKAQAEAVVREGSGAGAVIIRPTNIVGVGHPLDPLARLLRAIERGRFRVVDGSWTNYVSIDDVVTATLVAAREADPPSPVIVNEPLPLSAFAALAASVLEVSPPGVLPRWIGRSGRRIAPVLRRVGGLERTASLFDTTHLESEHEAWLEAHGVGGGLRATLREMVVDYRERGLL